MNRLKRGHIERGLVLTGVSLVSLGMYLPWVRVKPSHEGPINSIGLPGMETGITGLDAGLLSLGLIALVLVVRKNLSRYSSVFIIVAGLFYLCLPLFHALVILIPPFISNVGTFITGLGGVLMTIAGTIHLLGTVKEGEINA
jgi:hypothetical protein